LQVRHIDQGINPNSFHRIYFSGPNLMIGFRIGVVAGMVALTVTKTSLPILSFIFLAWEIISRISTNVLKVIEFFYQEAIAIGRTFAAMKDYQIDGNKEMVALGTMNIVGSFTSCYVATGNYQLRRKYLPSP
jgi:high affinity sulfate transporter 1